MLEIHAQTKPSTPTPAYREFRVPLSAVQRALSSGGSSDWLDTEIRKAHGWVSFQLPDKIADAIRLVSTVRLWEAIALRRNEDVGVTKARLRAIVDRRNQITHEADLDPTNPGERWPIDRPMVDQAIDFIESIVREIDEVATPIGQQAL